MTAQELIKKLELIQKMKCETSTLELKSAEKGCPQHLYDSLSGFSNQDEGGIIIFEYSCAVTPPIRQTGNRLSGLAETAYASLLA